MSHSEMSVEYPVVTPEDALVLPMGMFSLEGNRVLSYHTCTFPVDLIETDADLRTATWNVIEGCLAEGYLQDIAVSECVDTAVRDEIVKVLLFRMEYGFVCKRSLAEFYA